ncbi:hypothetical protein JCM25156A_25810 [Komagataeibacter kakiaceti JCM 25156]|uniref:hypothetical protein n=1 Tax=Komagataeibacter kakiaceti TaxID=943261 RepID=UPI000471E2E5|nr:hypothetical protein [Komagataeibacter kakiaceti]
MTKYAHFDSRQAAPSRVIGWYDSESFNALTLKSLPESDLLEVTDAQWSMRYPGPWAVGDGALVAHAPAATAVPLATRASAALTQARTHVLHHYKLLDEPTPAVWIAYLKALMAISDGTDTASTVLPASPAQ